MDPQVTTIPKEQLQKLNKLCSWLALESFGARCHKSVAKKPNSRAYNQGRADAFNDALAKVRDLFSSTAAQDSDPETPPAKENNSTSN